MAKTLDMTQGKPSKLLLQFAVPIIIGNLLQQVYIFVDRIIVGQWVGTNAFAAIGSTNALLFMFMSMCMGSAIGTGVVVSQYFGAKDERNVAAAIANSAYVNFVVAIVMTALALLLTRPLLILLNTPAALMADAAAFMQIYMGGLIAVSAYYTGFSILRALGDSKTPLIFLAFSSMLNVVLDLLFVIHLNMGVAGAATATVISQAIAAVLCLIYAFKKVPFFNMALYNAKPDKRLIMQMIKIGLPTGFQYSLMYLSNSVLQRIINGFGEVIIGAFTATSQIEILIQQPFAGLGAAVATYTGQNIGAGKTERVKQGMRASLWMCAVYSTALVVVFWSFGHSIMGVFVPNTDIISIAATGIRITSSFFMALGVMQVLRYLLNGVGDSIYALINGIVEIVGRIGLAVLLTNISFIGIWGIWLTTGLTWLLTCLLALWRYESGAWTKKSLVTAGNAAAEAENQQAVESVNS